MEGYLLEAIERQKAERDVVVIGSASVVHALARQDRVDVVPHQHSADRPGLRHAALRSGRCATRLSARRSGAEGWPAVLLRYERAIADDVRPLGEVERIAPHETCDRSYESEAGMEASKDPTRSRLRRSRESPFGSGVLLGGAGLVSASSATTLRMKDGQRLVQKTDPTPTRRRSLAASSTEVPDPDKALQWAVRCPSARRCGIESAGCAPPRD